MRWRGSISKRPRRDRDPAQHFGAGGRFLVSLRDRSRQRRTGQGQRRQVPVLPPDFNGPVPKGYYVFKSKTFGNWFGTRGFQMNGDPKPAVDNIKRRLRVYPLPVRCSRPTSSFQASAVRRRAWRSIPTPRLMSTSVRSRRPAARLTGADVARQGLERDPAALRSAAAVLRQDLEARRDRGNELT